MSKDDENKPKEDQESDNLIPFPADRLKKKREVKKAAGAAIDRKPTLFLSIAAVLVLATVLNQYMFTSEDRSIASGDGYVRDVEAEKRLAIELNGPDKRGPASFGREPSAEDRLRSGDLHSRYQLIYSKDGKVKEIKLKPGTSVANKPIYIQDRESFLERYRNVIAPGYDSVEADLDEDVSDLTTEKYNLMRGPASVGQANIKLDRSGAFHSLKVEVSGK